MRFEWDEKKRLQNLRKHGLDFRDAESVLDQETYRDVDERFARDEGEGFETVADWRAAHERFFGGYRNEPFTDDTLIVAERFRLVEVYAEPKPAK